MDFKKKEPKKNLTVRVDGEIVKSARKKKINISEVVRYALEQAVNGKLAEETTTKSRRGA